MKPLKRLTRANYFKPRAQMQFMSVSQFKAFDKCEAAALAQIKGEYEQPKSTALLVGSYVDSHFEGTLDIFKAKNPDLFKRNGELKSEYVQADEIINRIERDPLMMMFLDGRKQVIMTGEIAGVKVKIKVDALHDDKIVDLKVMKDFQNIYLPEQGRVSFIEAWGYDLQGAVYQEIVRQNTGLKLPFFIAAATKEKVPDIGIFEIEQELLDFELDKFKERVGAYDLIKKGVLPAERCEKCDYCKATKILEKVMKVSELNFD